MPFDDLPLEIIQYVFSLCCRNAVRFTIPEGPDGCRSGTTQVTLLLVCSRWRELALNTSALWGHVLVVYEPSERVRGHTASFQFVRDWLHRAGTTSISLEISVRRALESQIIAISQTLLSSFHFTNLTLSSSSSFFLVPANNGSRIKRLHLSLFNPTRTDVFPRLPEMPSLEELRLCLRPGHFADLTNIYLIPWHQLRVFFLGATCWSSRVLFNILRQCKSLVECSLVMKSDYGQHETNIILPNMEHLVLYICSNGNADPFIRSLTVPNLRTLGITSWHSYTRLPLSSEAIVTMAQCSGFKHFTDFSLCLTEQPVDVRSLFGSMPALESVQLSGPLMFQPGIFDDLSSGTTVPRLEEICFGKMSDEDIILMLEAIGQRHEKAKTVSDIRSFVSVTCDTSGSEFESLNQRANQCGEAFNTHVKIRWFPPDALATGLTFHEGDSD